MRTLILIFLLMGGSFLLLGQDSLILSSGEVVEGDILILYKDWVVIQPHGTKHPVEVAREGTTYRLGEDYLVRSPWSLGFRYGGTYWGTAQSLRNLLEEHGYEVPDPNQIRRPSWNPRNSPLLSIRC